MINPYKEVCKQCGSDHVYAKAWVNINTNKFWEWDDSYERSWCHECGEEVETIDERKYSENKNRDMIL